MRYWLSGVVFSFVLVNLAYHWVPISIVILSGGVYLALRFLAKDLMAFRKALITFSVLWVAWSLVVCVYFFPRMH